MSEVKKLLADLKVSELKNELEKRGLDKNGVKVTLVERLEKALTSEGHDAKTYEFTITDSAAASSPAKSPRKTAESGKDEEKAERGEETPAAKAGEAKEEVKAESTEPSKEEATKVEENQPETTEDTNESLEIVEVEEAEQDPEEAMETSEPATKPQEEAQKVPATPDVQQEEPVAMDTSEAPKTEGDQAEDEQVVVIPDSQEAKESSVKEVKEEAPKENVENEELDYEPSEQTEPEKKMETAPEEAESEEQEGNVATVTSEKPEASAEGEKKDNSLWIRGLPNSIKAADLKTAFSKYGKVITSKIFTTKNKQAPTCFGYITMADAESAKKCIQMLHRTNLKGRIINVEPADKMFPGKTPAKVVKENKDQPGTSSADAKKDEAKKDEKSTTAKKDTGRKPVRADNGRTREKAVIRREVRTRRSDIFASRRRPDLTSRRGIGSTAGRSVVSRMIARGRMAMRRGEPERERGYVRREVPLDYRVTRGGASYSSSRIGSRGTRGRGRGFGRDIDPRRPRTPPRYEDRAIEKARVERDRMREMMKRREEEHRKREEELRLERERERIRFEREKLEREKLELQQLKQLAALSAQQAYVPMPAAAPFMGAQVGGSGRDRGHERERERERERPTTKKIEPRRSGPSVSTGRRSRSPVARRRSPSGARGRGGPSRGRGGPSRGRGAPPSDSRYSRQEPPRREPTAAEKYAAYEREMAERERPRAYTDSRDARKEPPRTGGYTAGRGPSGRGSYPKNEPRGVGYEVRKIEPRGGDRSHSRETPRYGSNSSSAPYASTRNEPYGSSRSSGYSTSRDAPFAHPDPYSAAARAAPGYTDRYRSSDSLPATYRETQNYSSGSGRANETWTGRGSGSGSWADAAAPSGSSVSPWASGRPDAWQQGSSSYGSTSQSASSRGYDPYTIKSTQSGRRY